MLLSVIVPVLNEVESLPQLYREVTEVCGEHSLELEIIFVDDGSNDGSWETICSLADDDDRVSGIRFRRNFGKAAALTAAMQTASGDLILMMDADLQDDPVEIPRFLERLQEGCDVVNGWKERRLDPWHKVYPSKVFNGMVSRLTGLKLHDHNCGFKLFRAEVAEEIRLYGELHRFIPVLAHARGFRVAEIPVHHRRRQFGHSKYGWRRFMRGLLDLITVKFLTGFGQRPQHMLGAFGLVMFGIGGLGMSWLLVTWVLMNVFHVLPAVPIGNRPALAYSVAALLLGFQAMSLGLLAELIVDYTGGNRETFSVKERTGPRLHQRQEEPAGV